MKIKIIRIDKSLPLPKYHTKGSVAFDLYARCDTVINGKTIEKIPLNIIVEVPIGFMLALLPRSSFPKRYNLLYPHGVGIIDQDYCGPQDELSLQVYNFGTKEVIVRRGERIAQAVFIKIEKVKFNEVDIISRKSRGGFGSTD